MEKSRLPHLIIHLNHSSDPLPKAVLVAYRARRNLLSNTHGSTHCIRQCDRAGRLLRESLKLSYAKQNEEIVQVGLYTHSKGIYFL